MTQDTDGIYTTAVRIIPVICYFCTHVSGYSTSVVVIAMAMMNPGQGQAVPPEVAAKLKEMKAAKLKSKMPYWDLLEPVVQWQGPDVSVKLKCHMGCFLTCSNVSQTADRHFNVINGKLGCKKRVADQQTGAIRDVFDSRQEHSSMHWLNATYSAFMFICFILPKYMSRVLFTLASSCMRVREGAPARTRENGRGCNLVSERRNVGDANRFPHSK
jgi:hypothetical protein